MYANGGPLPEDDARHRVVLRPCGYLIPRSNPTHRGAAMSSEQMFDDVSDAGELIAQAIGAGSMCWENVRGAGVFDSMRAAAISDAAFQRLQMILAERFSHPEPPVGQVLTEPQEGR